MRVESLFRCRIAHDEPVLLVVVSGPPGVGKSALAAALAVRLGAAHVSIDPVEDAMRACGIPAADSGVAAYEAVRAAAETSLVAGRDVVVDAVNDSVPARSTWQRAADATGARLRFAVLSLRDAGLHRARLEGRRRPFAHVAEPTWRAVQDRAADPWPDDVLRLDAAPPVDELLAAVLRDLGRGGPAG